MFERVEETRCEKRLVEECCEEPVTEYREVARQQCGEDVFKTKWSRSRTGSALT